ncbi:hypothetical protein BCV70DRAFT_154840 [Testicularia cyperi]|uniref:NADPH-dependent diflavin oxidoreductase 1 n=1 Tax=Testicularia cyperi TaxID=1882483 RepID=A0A317Y1U0_9BASI|nr:hypothetical protein BCV70DRAFT_154840 [Testicularia cyperi]
MSAKPIASGSRPRAHEEAVVEDLADRRVTILYMTQSGTAEDVASRIARQATRKRYRVTISDVADYDVTDLVDEPIVLFVVATTGQGEFPTSSLPFWNLLLRKNLPRDILSDVSFAAFGLGDSSYARYCWPVRLLSRRLEHLGAAKLVEHGEGDDMHYLGIEGTLTPWLEQLWSQLDTLMPLPLGITEISRDEVLAPSTRIDVVDQNGTASTGNAHEDLTGHLKSIGWQTLKLVTNQRMTAKDHFQDVRLLEFLRPGLGSSEAPSALRQNGHESETRPLSLSAQDNGHVFPTTQFHYEPGDVLCLHPVNDATAVHEMLDRLDLSRSTLIKLSGPSVPITVPQDLLLTLHDLFAYHLDFTAVPKRSFFEQIRLFSPPSSLEREKLDEYCGIYPPGELAKGDVNPQDGVDEMFEYAQRPRRTIKEVLEEFKSIKIPIEHVADVFPWIKPREFSIASCTDYTTDKFQDDLARVDAGGQDKIQLAVAIVKYRTRLRKPRTGLCTRWLSSLSSGMQVPVRLKRGYLQLPPRDSSLILVGPGTGCAPLRSLVLDRLSSSSTSRPDIYLYLGFRYRAKDFLFGPDWSHLSKSHTNLNVSIAFSRDADEKVYVQDLVRADGAKLWDAIIHQNAYIIVAGASGRMPEHVKDAFVQIAKAQASFDDNQATRFLDTLERQGRWQEECWS